jgi:8-oxo-dGTP pyrophosphatase MutT (NUDIX family)
MTIAKPASTVLLVRPDANGRFEVLLTRRPEAMRFYGGFFVFPGGTIEPQDRSEKVLRRCRGLSAAEAEKILGVDSEPETAVAHWVAGIRELFEEVGIVMLNEASGAPARSDTEKFEQARRSMVAGALDFGAFLESENLFIDLKRAAYFSRRITPDGYPYRFDARFFVAALPEGQEALESSEEVDDSLWIAPDEALNQANRSLPLMPPTTTMLQNLAGHGSWKSLCEKFVISGR